MLYPSHQLKILWNPGRVDWEEVAQRYGGADVISIRKTGTREARVEYRSPEALERAFQEQRPEGIQLREWINRKKCPKRGTKRGAPQEEITPRKIAKQYENMQVKHDKTLQLGDPSAWKTAHIRGLGPWAEAGARKTVTTMQGKSGDGTMEWVAGTARGDRLENQDVWRTPAGGERDLMHFLVLDGHGPGARKAAEGTANIIMNQLNRTLGHAQKQYTAPEIQVAMRSAIRTAEVAAIKRTEKAETGDACTRMVSTLTNVQATRNRWGTSNVQQMQRQGQEEGHRIQTWKALMQDCGACLETKEGMMTGTTVLAATIDLNRQVHIAQVGDSGMIAIGDQGARWLTHPHRMKDLQEKQRFELRWGDQACQGGRVGGRLNITRTVGDASDKGRKGRGRRAWMVGWCLSQQSVQLTDGGQTLVMATDGVWDRLGIDDMKQIYRATMNQGEVSPAELLSNIMRALISSGDEDHWDNVTIVIIRITMRGKEE